MNIEDYREYCLSLGDDVEEKLPSRLFIMPVACWCSTFMATCFHSLIVITLVSSHSNVSQTEFKN